MVTDKTDMRVTAIEITGATIYRVTLSGAINGHEITLDAIWPDGRPAPRMGDTYALTVSAKSEADAWWRRPPIKWSSLSSRPTPLKRPEGTP